jgi:hypothetical protein
VRCLQSAFRLQLPAFGIKPQRTHSNAFLTTLSERAPGGHRVVTEKRTGIRMVKRQSHEIPKVQQHMLGLTESAGGKPAISYFPDVLSGF